MTSTTSALTFWGAKPWFGAARIDGVRGSELVVGLRSGAHFQQFRVITYRSGRLVSLPAPDPTLGWGVDASYSSNIGLFRAVSRSGAVRLTQKIAKRSGSGRHTGPTTVHRWASGGWRRISSKPTSYCTDRAAWAVGGWHVKGLPRSN